MIEGLFYFPNFITQEAADKCIELVDNSNWDNVYNRRTQSYGYKYDLGYDRNRVSNDFINYIIENYRVEPIPPILKNYSFESGMVYGDLPQNIITEIHKFDQLIINEYIDGQGISSHIDDVNWFSNDISIISLLSPIIMKFNNIKDKSLSYELLLEPNSMMYLRDEARYDWTHSIPIRKFDVINGVKTKRQRRVSLTYRKMKFTEFELSRYAHKL